MPDAKSTSTALSVLRETIVKRDDEIRGYAASPTGTRLVSMMRTFGYGLNRPLSVAEIIQISAVSVAVDVISQDIAKVPMYLYRKLPNGGKEVVRPQDHWLAGLLASKKANRFHTWYQFWEMVILHKTFVQNAYVAKRFKTINTVSELIPCMPVKTSIIAVDPDQDSAKMGFYAYEVLRNTPHERIQLAKLPNMFFEHEMLHFRGRMFDGLYGYSNLETGMAVFRLAHELNEYNTRLYANDGGMRGVFQRPGENGDALSDQAFENLRKELSELLTNMRRHNVPIVLEEGMTFESIAMNAVEADAAKNKEQVVVDVARIFRVPPHKIMHLAAVKYENLEPLERSYFRDTLLPVCRQIEEPMEASLLSNGEQWEYCLEFDRRQLLLNDPEALASVGKVLAQFGALELDEFRSMFEWNPLANNAGQARLIPANYNLVGRKNEIIIQGGGAKGDDSGQGDGGDKKPGKPKPKEVDPAILEIPDVIGER